MFRDIELSGTAVMISVLLIILLTLGIIYFMRYRFSKLSFSDLKSKYADSKWSSPLEGRTKYPDVDSFAYSGVLTKYGLMVAMALVLLAFSWTQREKSVYIPDGALDFDDVVEVEPPRTAEPPPPPPPPPPPVFQEVAEEDVVDEMPELSTEVDVEDYTPPPPKKEAAPPPPPPPPPPPKKEEEIFKIVEQMPRFPGCEDMKGTDAQKEECAKKKMIEFIYKNLKYPPIARENGIEGSAVIQFTVDKDGSIKDVEIVRDPGAGCGEAAKAAVEAMNNMPNKWTPGKQRGVPVKVLYTMPVKFKLEG